MNDLKDILGWIGGLGGSGMMVLVGWAVWSGRLILPRERDALLERTKELKAEAAEWKSAALSNRSLAHKATDALTTVSAAAQQSGTGVPS